MKELLSIIKLTESFKEFPSIGEKTAERLAYSILDMDESKIDLLIENLKEVKQNIHQCKICGALTEEEICSICSSTSRDHSLCIVVSNKKDVLNFEKIKTYRGVYHVLDGDISVTKGITPDKLRINELIKRIDEENIKELILATSPTLEGETTAQYLLKILQRKDIKITRLAYGLPMGSNLDYIDDLTISKAIEGRTNLK